MPYDEVRNICEAEEEPKRETELLTSSGKWFPDDIDEDSCSLVNTYTDTDNTTIEIWRSGTSYYIYKVSDLE